MRKCIECGKSLNKKELPSNREICGKCYTKINTLSSWSEIINPSEIKRASLKEARQK